MFDMRCLYAQSLEKVSEYRLEIAGRVMVRRTDDLCKATISADVTIHAFIMRPIQDEDIGIKVLVGSSHALVDVVAIHGRAAHPEHTWTCKDPNDAKRFICWLTHPEMLPSILKCEARIMQFGYYSHWAGPNKVHTSPRRASQGLLDNLEAYRADCPRRPLIVLAHSYGGFVAQAAITHAVSSGNSMFQSLYGIVFFGTPFRGSDPEASRVIRRLARKNDEKAYEYQLLSTLKGETIRILQDSFQNYIKSSGDGKPRLVFIYEIKETNVAEPFGKEGSQQNFEWVDEDTACLDIYDDALEKFPRNRDHFNLNTFDSISSGEWQTMRNIITRMMEQGPSRMARRPHLQHWRLTGGRWYGTITESAALFWQAVTSDFCSRSTKILPMVSLALSQRSIQTTHASPKSPADLAPNASQVEPSGLWKQLGQDQKWIRSGMPYWRRMTFHSYQVYREICLSCLKDDKQVYISCASLCANLADAVQQDRVEQIWRRLLPAGENKLPNMLTAYVLAVLYMLHVEQQENLTLPEDEHGSSEAVDKLQREAIKRWRRWTRCGCSQECVVEWNFANPDGIYRHSTTHCRVYNESQHPQNGKVMFQQERKRLYKQWWNGSTNS